MASLEIRNICKSYGPVKVLDDVSVTADHGEFLVLLGPSGCGKSTLLGAIAGLEHVDSGHILIDGRKIDALEPKARDIAMVFQSYALYPSMTVRQNICFGMRVRGVAKAEQAAQVNRVAKMLQLDALLDRRPAHLSGGQRQRVAMGRALVRSPKVFLFDEPLSNLDALLRVDMRTEIKKLHKTVATTSVYVTHDQIEAMTLASKIVVMRLGVIQQVGTPRQIYDRPANTFVAGFIGSPPMNLIPATLRLAAGRVEVSFRRAGLPDASIDMGPAMAALAPHDGRTVTLGIRPEALAEAGDADAAAGLDLDAVVEVVEPTGADTFGILTLGGREAAAKLKPGHVRVDQVCRFTLDRQNILLFDPDTGLLLN